MPLEIMTLILRFLLALLPFSEVIPHEPDNPWLDFTRCRCGLHSICSVSCHFLHVGCLLLYCIVPILDEVGIIFFLCTLCCKPEYSLWTRGFACYINLTAPTVA